MKKLLKKLEDLKGKTIENIEITDYSFSNIVINTTDECVLVLSASVGWDRCGDFEGIDVYVETDFSYKEKEELGVLTEEEVKLYEIEKEKKRKQRLEREEKERKKAQEAQDRMKKNELELLKKLKDKYEK